MKINKQFKKEIELAVKASFIKGKLLALKATKFTKLFKALPQTKAIQALSLYNKGLKRELQKKTLTVESVFPLSGNDLSKIKKAVSKNFEVLETKNVLNKSLFGGLKVYIGDVSIDDSLSYKIEQVAGVIAR